MTPNDMSIGVGVLDDTRDVDTVIDSKDTSENSAIHITDAEASHTGKHAVFNEDEDDLKYEKAVEEALGDVTNRHDNTISGKELKTQRSRSALIFDEVDDTRSKSPAVQNDDVPSGVTEKEDVPEKNLAAVAEHVEENVDEDLSKTSTTLQINDEVNSNSASIPKIKKEVDSIPSDEAAEKHELTENIQYDTQPFVTEDVVLESPKMPVEDAVAATTEYDSNIEALVPTVLDEDAAATEAKSRDVQEEVDSLLKEGVNEQILNDEEAKIVKDTKEVQDIQEELKEEKIATQEATPLISVVNESIEEQASILRSDHTEDVASKSLQIPFVDTDATTNENIDSDEVSVPTPLKEDVAVVKVEGVKDKDDTSNFVHEDGIVKKAANDEVAAALKNDDEVETTPVITHVVEDVSEQSKEEKVVIEETTPLIDAVKNLSEEQAMAEDPEVDENKEVKETIETISHPNPFNDAQVPKENLPELPAVQPEVIQPEKEVNKDADEVSVPTATLLENAAEKKIVDDNPQVTEVINIEEAKTELNNGLAIHDPTSMGHVEHSSEITGSNESPKPPVESDIIVSHAPEEEIKTDEVVIVKSVVDATADTPHDTIKELTEADNTRHALSSDDHSDVNKNIIENSEDSVAEQHLADKNEELKASDVHTEAAPDNQVDLTKEIVVSETSAQVVHDEQISEQIKLPETIEALSSESASLPKNDLHYETAPSTNVSPNVEVKEAVEIVQPNAEPLLEEEQIKGSNEDSSHVIHEEVQQISVPPLENAENDANAKVSLSHTDSNLDNKSGHVKEIVGTHPQAHSEQGHEFEEVEHPKVVEASVDELAILKEDNLHVENAISATVTSDVIAEEANDIVKQEIEAPVPNIIEALPTTQQTEDFIEESKEQSNLPRDTNDETEQIENDQGTILVVPDAVDVFEDNSYPSEMGGATPESSNDHTEGNLELAADTSHDTKHIESTAPLVDHHVRNNLDIVDEHTENLTVSEHKSENIVEINGNEVLPANLQDDGRNGVLLPDTVEKEAPVDSSQDIAKEDHREDIPTRDAVPTENVDVMKEKAVGNNDAIDEVKGSVTTNDIVLPDLSKAEEKDAVVNAVNAVLQEEKFTENVEQTKEATEFEKIISSETDKTIFISDEHVTKLEDELVEQNVVDVTASTAVAMDENPIAKVHNDESKDTEIPEAILPAGITVENEAIDTSQPEMENNVLQESEAVFTPTEISESFQNETEQSIPGAVSNSNDDSHEKNTDLVPSVIDQKLESLASTEVPKDSEETETQVESIIQQPEVNLSELKQPDSAETVEPTKEVETGILDGKEREPPVEITNTSPNVDLYAPPTTEESPEHAIEEIRNHGLDNKLEHGHILHDKLETQSESVEVLETSNSVDIEPDSNKLMSNKIQLTQEPIISIANVFENDVSKITVEDQQQSKIQEQTEGDAPIPPRGFSVDADAEKLPPHLDVTPDSHMIVTAKANDSEVVEAKVTNTPESSELTSEITEEEKSVSQSQVETAPITQHEKAITTQVSDEIHPDVNIEETPAIMEREDEVHDLDENERSAELSDGTVTTISNKVNEPTIATSSSEIPGTDEEKSVQDTLLQAHEHVITEHTEKMTPSTVPEVGSCPSLLQSSKSQINVNNQSVEAPYLPTTIQDPTDSVAKDISENELFEERKVLTSEGTMANITELVKDTDENRDTEITASDAPLTMQVQGQLELEDQDDLYVNPTDSNEPHDISDNMDLPESAERPKSPYPISYSVTTIGHASLDEDTQENDDLIDDNATIPTIRTNTEDNLSETTDVPSIPTEVSEEPVQRIDEVVHGVNVVTDEQEPVTLRVVGFTPGVEVLPEDETFVRETSAAEDDARMTQVTPVPSRENKKDEPPTSVASPLTTELTVDLGEAVSSAVTSPTIVPSFIPLVAMNDNLTQSTIQEAFMDAISDVANKKSFELTPLDGNVEEQPSLGTSTDHSGKLNGNAEVSKSSTNENNETQAAMTVPTTVPDSDIQKTSSQDLIHIQDEAVSEHISEDEMHAVIDEDHESIMGTPVRTPHSMAGERAFSDVVSEDLPPPYEDPLAAERNTSSQIPDNSGNDTIAGQSVPEKQQTLNLDEDEDDQRLQSPQPRSFVVTNQGSEPSELSDTEQNFIDRPEKTRDVEATTTTHAEDDEQNATPKEILPIETDDLVDISSSVQDLAEVDEEVSLLDQEKVIPNLSTETGLPTDGDIVRPKTPIISSYAVTEQDGDLIYKDKDLAEPDITEDLSASMQTVQVPIIPDNRSEIGTIPSEKDFDENIVSVEDELTADDSVSDIAPSDIPEAPNTPRSELSSLASGFDSRSEVSAASRRPIAPASPRLDPDVENNEMNGKDSTTIRTPVLLSLEPAIKEALKDFEVETPQPDVDTSTEIPPPRRQIAPKALSEQLSGYSAEDEFSNGAHIPRTEEDNTDDTDGILDIIPEESFLKSRPIDLSSVITHDSDDIRPLSFTQESIIKPSNREIELTDDEESIRDADILSRREDDLDEVSYAESVSVSDDPSISIVDSEVDEHESVISSIASENSLLSIPVAPVVEHEEIVSSVSTPPRDDEDHDDASELLSSVADVSHAPPSLSGSKLASDVGLSESGCESDVPLSEIEDPAENIETDNITLKPRDEEEAIPIMDNEDDLEASLDSSVQPVNSAQLSDSSLKPITPVPSKVIDSIIADVHNEDYTILSKAPDHDVDEQAKIQPHVNEETVSDLIVARRTAIAQRPVSSKILTPKKKKENQKHDRVSSGRSWDEMFHPRDNDDEDIRSRSSNGDAESLRGSLPGRGSVKKRGALPTFVFPSAERMVEEEPVIVSKPEPLSLHTAPPMQRNDSSTTSSSSPGLLDVASPTGRPRLESTASSVAPFFPGAWLPTPTLPERMSLDTAQGTFYASSMHISTSSTSASRSPVEPGQSSSTDPQGSESEGPVDAKTKKIKKTKKRSRDCIIM